MMMLLSQVFERMKIKREIAIKKTIALISAAVVFLSVTRATRMKNDFDLAPTPASLLSIIRAVAAQKVIDLLTAAAALLSGKRAAQIDSTLDLTKSPAVELAGEEVVQLDSDIGLSDAPASVLEGEERLWLDSFLGLLSHIHAAIGVRRTMWFGRVSKLEGATASTLRRSLQLMMEYSGTVVAADSREVHVEETMTMDAEVRPVSADTVPVEIKRAVALDIFLGLDAVFRKELSAVRQIVTGHTAGLSTAPAAETPADRAVRFDSGVELEEVPAAVVEANKSERLSVDAPLLHGDGKVLDFDRAIVMGSVCKLFCWNGFFPPVQTGSNLYIRSAWVSWSEDANLNIDITLFYSPVQTDNNLHIQSAYKSYADGNDGYIDMDVYYPPKQTGSDLFITSMESMKGGVDNG